MNNPHIRKNFKAPVTTESFSAPGWGSAEAWHRTVNEIRRKIATDGCWASASIRPLTRKSDGKRS